MLFKDKLSFLMNVTHTSNKELAHAIFVDPSLISLLRSGKRSIPRNHEHIENMAIYFSKHCTADFQRYALAEMFGQSVLRRALPSDIVADYIYKWLIKENDIVEHIIEGIEESDMDSTIITDTNFNKNSMPTQETVFFYGEEERRQAIYHLINIIGTIKKPCTILVTSGDYLEWLLEDSQLSNEFQNHLVQLVKSNVRIKQIMKPTTYLSDFVDSLRYWLPIYITGQVDVYYYPRMADKLYQSNFIIVPNQGALISTQIGQDKQSVITTVSNDPKLINAYTQQFETYAKLCQHALIAHNHFQEFGQLFKDFFSKRGFTIQKVATLSANTIPKECLELCIEKTKDTFGQATFQSYLNEVDSFEERLKNDVFVDISCFSSVEDICAGNVAIASPFKTSEAHPVYTPQTYIMHLKNILRLMEEYENYYFLPLHHDKHQNYGLTVCENELALLIRTTTPPLVLEIRRPEIVEGCREHLVQLAEGEGYKGIEKEKIKIQINNLIHELQNSISSEREL